jgi:PAS domain S-box-containing protein
MIAVGLGSILALHVMVLAIAQVAFRHTVASEGLQALSVVLACVFAGQAALRSQDFVRTFWAFSSAGFALLVFALPVRHFEPVVGFGISDFIFLLHMVPFGLILLLNEDSRGRRASIWPMMLDYTQVLIILAMLFIAFIYIPAKTASVVHIHSLDRIFAVILIARNVGITGGFWLRSLLANSERARLAFRSMGIYLSIYVVGSAFTHCMYLKYPAATFAPMWIELQGSVPFLAAAWLFSRWRDLPVSAKSEIHRFRAVLSLQLVPAILPLVVAGSAIWIAESEPRLAGLVVAGSVLVFALRLLATIYSEYRANEEVRQGEQRYRTLVLATAEIVWTTNGQDEAIEGEGMWAKFGGIGKKEIQDRGWIRAVHPDDREAIEEVWSKAVQNRTGCYSECRLLRYDGEYRDMAIRRVPVLGTGVNVREWVGTCTDITGHKRLQDELVQSQKLDAVGRLAGGIAHDFNNLLGVIGLSIKVLADQIGDDTTLTSIAEEITTAVKSAEALVSQLLAFSRKQLLQPQVLSLNLVVSETAKMLRRFLGEGIILSLNLDPEAGNVKADVAQLQQVVMNLAVNARDAMPEGGSLTIRTENTDPDCDGVHKLKFLRAGRYVRLTVTDTGVGMDERTRRHAFEPFFTTKPQGNGTGWGLATVYGIVKHTGGYISLSSEPGKGTVADVYLTRVDDSPVQIAPMLSVDSRTGIETILLVEDYVVLRKMIRRGLERNGYTVITAGNGPEALNVAKSYKGLIHLLITDIIMPEMNGQQLAERVAEQRPGIGVLYMSGHTYEILGEHGVLNSKVAFIKKPFDMSCLFTSIEEALKSTPSRINAPTLAPHSGHNATAKVRIDSSV